MTFLFRSGTVKEKLRSVFDATKTHAQNLATFVLLFKTLSVLLSTKAIPQDPATLTATSPAAKNGPGIDHFLAGAIAGYLVFGRDGKNPVNQQIVLYVFGRTMMGLLKLAGQETGLSNWDGDKGRWWGLFAAASWGGVMWMFKNHPKLLQNSLTSSMVYLYVDPDSDVEVRSANMFAGTMTARFGVRGRLSFGTTSRLLDVSCVVFIPFLFLAPIYPCIYCSNLFLLAF